ncbi:MAG: hypothetical protein R2860_01555 [Desulfobacterales bacterium]
MALTKAVMMTAYASTDTAVKAIRLGALDYIPKALHAGRTAKYHQPGRQR